MSVDRLKMMNESQHRVQLVEAKPKAAVYDIPDDTKVLVATPNYTNLFSSEVHTNHVECVSMWKEWGLNYKWMIIGRTFVHFARSQACRVALDGGYTHVFWLDDDAIIDPEVLPKLLARDKDVVISPYPMRRSPFEIGILSAKSFYCRDCKHRFECDLNVTPPMSLPCPKCGGDVPRDFHEHSSYRNLKASEMKQGLVDVDGGGTHAFLMKTDILRKARGSEPPRRDRPMAPDNRSYPDRAYEVYLDLSEISDRLADRELVDHYIGDLPDQRRTMEEEEQQDKPYFTMPKAGTEDMLFCYRIKCKGVQIFCDTDVFADHVGFAPVVNLDFVSKMEEVRRSGHDGNVVLAAVGERGRDHTKFDTRTNASMV